MVARLTPDQKVACSNHVRVTHFFFSLHHFSPIFFFFCWLPFKCFSDLSSKKYSCCKNTSLASRLLLFCFVHRFVFKVLHGGRKAWECLSMFGGREVDMGGNAYHQITYSTRSLCCQRQRLGTYIVVSRKSPHGWSSFQAKEGRGTLSNVSAKEHPLSNSVPSKLLRCGRTVKAQVLTARNTMNGNSHVRISIATLGQAHQRPLSWDLPAHYCLQAMTHPLLMAVAPSIYCLLVTNNE